MKVNRESFLRTLESVQPGTSLREILEQSSCFVFQDGQAMTFNEEIACRAPTGLDKTIVGAVPSNPLLETLRKRPEDEVEIEIDGPIFIVGGKGRRTEFNMEAEISLPIGMVETPKTWKKLHEEFCDAIATVGACASQDQTQFAYTCVHVHPKWVEASDNNQVCRWRLQTGVEESVLVRQTSIKHVPPLGMTEFTETKSWLHFRNPNGLILSCRRYIEEYRSFGEFLKTEGSPIVLPKGLIEACERCLVFTGELKDANLVTVRLSPGKLSIIGVGISGRHREARKIAWEGNTIEFSISPVLLSEIVKKHNDCQMTAEPLRVKNDRFTFVACLNPVESREEVGAT